VKELIFELGLDTLKDDSSWRRLTALLHDVEVLDHQLETMMARFKKRLRGEMPIRLR
jgi:hypothetical protein